MTARHDYPTKTFLGVTSAIALCAAGSLMSPAVAGGGSGNQVTLTGFARDFRGATHPDFDVDPPDGKGHYAGNVSQILGEDGAPLQVHGVSDFEIDYGTLVPGVPYAARLSVLGSEITSGGTPIPVTLQTETNTQTFEPFGSYLNPGGVGNVNDGNNPRHFIYSLDEVYSAQTPISVTATSWLPSFSTDEFGNTSSYSSKSTDGGDNQLATQVTMPEDGTVTSITARLYRTSGDDDIMYALYDDNGGEPGDLVVQTIEGNSPSSGWNWVTLDCNDTFISAGTYWLAVSHESDGNQAIGYTSSSGYQMREHWENAVDNGFVATWSSSTASWNNRRMSIYATYTSSTPTYNQHMTVKSGDNSPYVLVLRDGSSVPNIPAFQNQTNLAVFVQPYVNAATGKVVLQDNQAIYLFELGTTNLGSSSADFQDLVIMVTLATDPVYFFSPDTVSEGLNPIGFKVASQWRDSSGNNIAPHLYTPALDDLVGASGITSSGGVTSPATYYQWFRDCLGENMGTTADITLTEDGDGVYEFQTGNFYPIDGQLYGNETGSHNDNFTYAVAAKFTYDPLADQFIEFKGGDGCWIFVDGKLAIDLGGVKSDVEQHVDLSRMALVPGAQCEIRLFYANRGSDKSFELRTNVFMTPGPILGDVTGTFD